MNQVYKEKNIRQTTRETYQMITVFKVLCAFLVVYIHTFCGQSLFGNMFLVCFTRQAVPFFFVVSGFLLGERINYCGFDWNYIKKYIFNLLLVYGIWGLLWLPNIISVYGKKNAGESILYTVLTVFRRLLFTGNGVYWYLLILVESVIIIAFLVSKKKENILLWIAFPLLILGIIYEYQINVPGGELNLINKIFYYLFGSNDNVIMKGLPYCGLGFVISKRKEMLYCKSPLFLWILYFAECMVGMVIYYSLCPYDVGVMVPFQAITMLVIAIQYREEIVDVKYDKRLRNLSSVLYLSHTVFLLFFPTSIIVNWGIAYIATVGCSILLWCILEKTKIKCLMRIFLMK